MCAIPSLSLPKHSTKLIPLNYTVSIFWKTLACIFNLYFEFTRIYQPQKLKNIYDQKFRNMYLFRNTYSFSICALRLLSTKFQLPNLKILQTPIFLPECDFAHEAEIQVVNQSTNFFKNLLSYHLTLLVEESTIQPWKIFFQHRSMNIFNKMKL